MNITAPSTRSPGPRPRRRPRGHLRLPEHRRHREWFPGRAASRRSTPPSPGSSIAASSTTKAPTASAPQARPTSRSTARDLARVHGVRSALREVAHVDRRAPGARHRRRSTRSIGRSTPARSSSSSRRPTASSVDHRHVGDPVDDALARLADPLVLELTAGHPERIKTCASETCDWIFYDASRTSRRRWCDMATCGNRAKAARHRARERAVQRRTRRTRRARRRTASPDAYSAARHLGEHRLDRLDGAHQGRRLGRDHDLRVRAERELAQRVELEDGDQRRVRVLRR